MNSIQNWGEAISLALFDLWERFVNFLPSLIGALLVFLVGLFVASILGKMAEKIIAAFKIDKAVEKMNLAERMNLTGFKLSVSKFFGELVRWFLILVFLMASADILGLNQITNFLNSIILYIPNIVVAVIILSVAFLLGNFTHSVVCSSVKATGVIKAEFLAAISKWAIIIFGLLAALIQLGVAESLANTIFMGIVAALSLAFGLAFGLGGREEAALILRKIRKSISPEEDR